MRVSVQVFSYRERYGDLWRTMDAYADCAVPSFVTDVEYLACVTPADVTASSPRAAREHPKFALHPTPGGKLSSRNDAHERATRAGYDAIVAGDADAPPLGEGYLERLLDPLTDASVAAANSSPQTGGVLGLAVDAAAWVEGVVAPHMNGQGHAFTADAWAAAGPFDDGIDQTDIGQVRSEEEFRFRRRLAAQGRVVDVSAARVRNDGRRHRCTVQSVRPGGPRDPWCADRGLHTFGPGAER